MQKILFIHNDLPHKTKFYELLAKKFEITIALINQKAIVFKGKNIQQIVIKQKKKGLFSNNLTKLVELQKAIKNADKVIISHNKLPSKINKLLNLYSEPQKTIVWSEYLEDEYIKNKIRKSAITLGYYFRALKTNTVVATSKENKQVIEKIGLPQTGQDIVLINKASYTKSELQKITKSEIKNDKSLILGLNAEFILEDELLDSISGFRFFRNDDTKLLIATKNEISNKKILNEVLKDKRISIERIEEKKLMEKVDAILIPTKKKEYSETVIKSLVYGKPVIAPDNLPSVHIIKDIGKELVLKKLSPMFITKAITELHDLKQSSTKWKEFTQKVIKSAHKITIEDEIEEWGRVINE